MGQCLGLSDPDLMRVIPVNFASEHKQMLSHLIDFHKSNLFSCYQSMFIIPQVALSNSQASIRHEDNQGCDQIDKS